MKKTVKLICFAMAMVMLCLVCASCSKEVVATVSIKFVSGVDENGKEIVELEQPAFTVKGTTDNLPTVLMAAQQVLLEYELPYALSSDGHSIGEVFGYKEEESHDENFGYFKYWKCTIDGQDSTEGRQSATPIYEGSQIVFTWVEDKRAREDTVAQETTNPADFETEYVETEPEETEAEEE